VTADDKLFGISGGSGGYLEYIFRYAAKELFGVVVDKIEYESKGPDYNVATLNVDGKAVLTFAAAYGMRHIPNILRTVKGTAKKSKFDFVEIMACPGGMKAIQAE
jgi:iron only hydrogenase large subunit-like protein